jgi:branched-chain amino acid transport system permease protein
LPSVGRSRKSTAPQATQIGAVGFWEADLAEYLQLIINGLAVGCIYGLVALGFVLIYKATEMVNFAQGDLMMLGAFVAYTFITLLGWNYWLSFLLAVIILAAFGALIDVVILRRVIGQPPFAVVMLTLGLGFIFRSFASMSWGSETYTVLTPFSSKVVHFGSVVISDEYLSIIAGTVLLCAVLYAFFRYTRIGVAMQAASQNQLAAYYMGIPVKLIFSLIWAISAGVAVVAGVLLAPVSLIDTNMGFIGLKAFAAAVLGGFGSIPGALVGGLIVGVIEVLAGFKLPEGFKDVAAYVVLLTVLVLRPQGLFGALARKKV